jgi:hypothetical protein
VTWDCMFIPHMLPGSGGQDVTPFGRDRRSERLNHGMMSATRSRTPEYNETVETWRVSGVSEVSVLTPSPTWVY